MSQINVNCVKD